MQTDATKVQNWQQQQLAQLYEAILNRMVITYCLNELVKSGVKTPLKDGVLDMLRQQQKQANFTITTVVRRIDRGIQE